MAQRAGHRWQEVEPIVERSCQRCHTTCGECHVSWPRPAEGGLIAGHEFFKVPPPQATCDTCHNGRVGPEYFGRNAGYPADAHWAEVQMTCTGCHSARELHGDGTPYPTRHQVKEKPSCLGCHPDAAPGASKIQAHNVHGEKLSCHACHSIAYVNCYGCHIGRGARSELDFKIGLDPRGGELPRYTTVRHAPTARSMLDAVLPNAMPNYDAVPTWWPTAPHNIQRITPQNQTCNGCHGNPEVFLRPEGLDPREPRANEKVAVAKVPERR